jgi:hypothetical protein
MRTAGGVFVLQDLGNVVTILGAPAAVYAWWVSKRRDRHLQRRELYQSLELASLDLFRFEAEHPELVEALWVEGSLPPDADVTARYTAENYAAQFLNLFEIAVRLRSEGALPEEAFGSWVAWIWSVAGAPGFAALWPSLRPHYVERLRTLMDEALELQDQPGGEAAFYAAVGRMFECPIVREWPQRPPVR